MADKKRKAGGLSPGKKTPSSTRAPKRPRPSVEFVEVSSDTAEEKPSKAIMRGLSVKNRLPKMQQSVEQLDDGDGAGDNNNDNDDREKATNEDSRHMTRGARHGRTDARIKYDSKCKPRPSCLYDTDDMLTK